MKNTVLQKLTVILISYNRHELLIRAIKYWSNFDIKVVIIDGSDVRLNDSYLNYKNIRYVHDQRSLNDRLLNSFKYIDTEFMILACDDEFLRTRYGDTDSKAERYILDNVEGSFLYVDQFGVLRPDSFSSGIVVKRMADSAIASARESELDKIVAFVLHEPIKNVKSSRFLGDLGFKSGEEVGIAGDIVLGFYEMGL